MRQRKGVRDMGNEYKQLYSKECGCSTMGKDGYSDGDYGIQELILKSCKEHEFVTVLQNKGADVIK